VLVVAETPGGTSEQDDEIMEAIGVRTNPPTASHFRLAGPTDGGWRIVALWESREAFEAFMQERLRPALQDAGVRPDVTFWDIEKVDMWDERR
jgi:hypothetical protein